MEEETLHPSRVFWRFLAGGAGPLRLPRPMVALLAGGGALLLGGVAVACAPATANPWAVSTAVALATSTVVLVAALAARWLGGTLGTLAGVCQLTSVGVLLSGMAPVGDVLLRTGVAVALGAFAVANVPGRLPLVEDRSTRWVFYAATGVALVAAGPAGPAFIFAGCFLYLLVSNDARGARFFLDPVGIAIFVSLALVSLVTADGWRVAHAGVGAGASPHWPFLDLMAWLLVGSLPWTPLVVVAVGFALWQGYYATPVWRWFGCWVLGPLILVGVGLFRAAPHVDVVLAPLAVIAAAGLWELLVWCRRVGRQLKSCKETTSAIRRGSAGASRSTPQKISR